MTFQQAKKKYHNRIVNILGKPYTIKFTADWSKEDKDCAAIINYEHQTILIDENVIKNDWWFLSFKCTLIHEIIHGFMEESGLCRTIDEKDSWVQNEDNIEWFSKQWDKINGALKELELL